MQLSVVILNYNVRYFLELCLQSVEAAIAELDAEIIVVDNHSTDGSCEMVRTLFPKVKLIENQSNFGFSKGNNMGVAKAKGEYVCILNPDTVVAEDTFQILLEFAQRTPKMGIVGCKLIDGTGAFLPESKRNVPTPLVSLRKILGDASAYYAHHIGENDLGSVQILVGAFMLLRRAVYNEIGGFDEAFFMYGEDMDFSFCMTKAGYQNYYNPSTVVIHYKGESTLKDRTYAKRFYSAMQVFFRKHYRLNGFYNALVWLGIQWIALFNPQPRQKTVPVAAYVHVGNALDPSLEAQLDKPVQGYAHGSKLKAHSQVIFDNASMTFKEIIAFMDRSDASAKLTFKIRPKNARFIIGSNSSKSRGEVIQF